MFSAMTTDGGLSYYVDDPKPTEAGWSRYWHARQENGVWLILNHQDRKVKPEGELGRQIIKSIERAVFK